MTTAKKKLEKELLLYFGITNHSTLVDAEKQRPDDFVNAIKALDMWTEFTVRKNKEDAKCVPVDMMSRFAEEAQLKSILAKTITELEKNIVLTFKIQPDPNYQAGIFQMVKNHNRSIGVGPTPRNFK